MSARIEIAEDARRWLIRRGSAAVIRTSPRHGCCGGLAGVPVAEPGAPDSATGYRHKRIGGIDVYIDPRLDGANTLTISLQGFGGLRRLFVDGAGLSGSGHSAAVQ